MLFLKYSSGLRRWLQLKCLLNKHEDKSWVPKTHASTRWVLQSTCHSTLERQRQSITRVRGLARLAISRSSGFDWETCLGVDKVEEPWRRMIPDINLRLHMHTHAHICAPTNLCAHTHTYEKMHIYVYEKWKTWYINLKIKVLWPLDASLKNFLHHFHCMIFTFVPLLS